MNNFIKSGIIFLAGAAIGAFGYKKYLDYKENREPEYDEIIEPDDVEDMKDDKKIESKVSKEPVKHIAKREDNVDRGTEEKMTSVNQDEYKRLLNDLRYQNIEEDEHEPEQPSMVLRRDETIVNPELPYNISPDEFEEDDYESDEYILYADGYITDNYGMPLSEEDILNSIGDNYNSYFGSYDDNQIWVRNERLRMDFSVIKDEDRFVDVATPRVRRMVGL